MFQPQKLVASSCYKVTVKNTANNWNTFSTDIIRSNDDQKPSNEIIEFHEFIILTDMKHKKFHEKL